MASDGIREDIVQLTVAALDAAPDAALMRELETIIDARGGTLLEVAAALTEGERWEESYPASQTPAEFSNAWLETLLPGVSAELLAFGRTVVVPHIEAGNGPGGLVLAAQDFLSAPGVPADFAAFAGAFLERSASAMEELAASERVEDLVQLTVAAYDAAPGAALMAELEAVVDGGGTLLEAAEALVADERWEALYPASQTPAEFSDAWLGTLLPGVDADLLAFGRTVVVPHIEAGNGPAGLVLAAQEFLSGTAVPADFAGFAEAFLNRSEVAAEHSTVRMLDGTAEELRDALASVTGDDATVQAAIDALDDSMPGDQMPGDQMPGDQMPGDQMPGGSGGGGAGGGSGGGAGGGGQTPAVPTSRDATDDQGRVVLSEFDEDMDGTHERAEAYEYGAGDLKTKTSWYDDWALEADGTGKALDMQTIDRALTVMDGDRDGTGDSRRHDVYAADGKIVLESLIDEDNVADGVWERAEGYERDGEGRLILRKTGAVEGTDPESATVDYGEAEIHILDAAGGTTETRFFDAYDGTSVFAMLEAGTADRIHYFGVELDADGSDDARYEKLDADGRAVEVLFDIDGDGADRAEAYAWDAAGRKTEARFHDAWTGTFDLSGAAADRIHAWTYGADAADDRWLTFSEDLDGDGHVDRRTTLVYPPGGGDAVQRKVELDEDDDGTFDVALLTELGDPADDADDRLSRKTYVPDPVDGSHTKAEEYEYDAEGRVVKTLFYDSWDAAPGAVNTADRTVDIAIRYTRDGQDRITLAEFDDDGNGTFDRAEAYEYGAGDLRVKTAWYDVWAVKMDGAGKDLADQVIDRVLTVADDDGDGTGESSRHDKYDAAGALVVESLFDDDHDGTVDRAEAYAWDAAGRKTEIRFFEPWTGTFGLFGAAPGKIRSWTYDAADAADKRHLSFSEDFDGDGNVDIKTAVTHHGAEDVLKTRRTEYDDGSGGGTADDGTVDKITLEGFNAKGGLELIRHDDDGDGTYERAEAHVWNAAGTAKVRTDFYDDWDDGKDAAAQQADRSVHFLQDYDGDGAGDDGKTETFDGDGRAVRVAYDHDTDGTLDVVEVLDPENGGRPVRRSLDPDPVTGAFTRQEAYTYDGAGLKTLTAFDAGHDDSYEKAEERRYDAGGLLTRILHYDVYDETKALAEQAVSRSVWLRQDYDGDDASDDGKTETFDGEGRPVRVAYDYDADDKINLIETWTYSAAAAVRLRELDDGMGSGAGGKTAGDGVFDRRVEETLEDGAVVRTLTDADNDGTWDETAEVFPRYEYKDGLLVGARHDDDGDGTADRRETYTRDEGGVLTKREVELDDGFGGAAAQDGTWDRGWEETWEGGLRAKVRLDHDSDGFWDRTYLFAYEGGSRPASVKAENDSNDDGTADGLIEFPITYGTDGNDAIQGAGVAELFVAGKGDDVITGGGGRDRFIFREGDGKDHVTDFAGTTLFFAEKDFLWIAGGESGFDASDLESRTVDGAAAMVYGHGGLGGEIRLPDVPIDERVFYEFEDAPAAPGGAARDVARDAAGRITEIRHIDNWDGVADPGILPAARVHRYAYEGGEWGWKTLSMNDDAFADDIFETRVTLTRDAAGAVTSRLFEYDDGKGEGANGKTAGDGVFDRNRRDEFNEEGRIVKILHDSDLDGVWNYIDVYTYETGTQPPTRRAQRTDTMDDDDPANDKTTDLARLVFGTDGDDHGSDQKELSGNSFHNDWQIPGPGDDTLANGRGAGTDMQGKDVHIFRYGDGVNLVRGFGPEGSAVHDTIWVAEEKFSTADVSVVESVTLTPATDPADHPGIPSRAFPGAGEGDVKITVLAYGGGPGDRIVLEGWDSDDVDYFRERFVSVPADIAYDPHSFVYGSRNAVLAPDEAGGASSSRVYDAWDGIDAEDTAVLPHRTHIDHYHDDGATLAVRLDEADGIAGPLDGTVDRRTETAYDASGDLVRVRHDDDGDGKWDRIVIHAPAGGGDIGLDLGNRIETYARSGGIIIGLSLYDDGMGTGRHGAVAGDGKIDRRMQETIVGDAIIRTVVDTDNDGEWDETADGRIPDGSRFTYHSEDGGRLLRAEFDDDTADTVDYDRAEVYHWRDGAVARTDFYDPWDAGADIADQSSNKVLAAHYGVERDDDYRYDDIRYERFDSVTGKADLVLYDHDSDGSLDQALTIEGHIKVVSWRGTHERPRLMHTGAPSSDDPFTATVESVTGRERLTYRSGERFDGSLKIAVVDDDNDGTYTKTRWYFINEFDGHDVSRGRPITIFYNDDGNWENSKDPFDRRFTLSDEDGDGSADDYRFTHTNESVDVFDYGGDGTLDFIIRAYHIGDALMSREYNFTDRYQREGVPASNDPWSRDGDWTAETRFSYWHVNPVDLFLSDPEIVERLREIDDDYDGTYDRAEADVYTRAASGLERTDYYENWNQSYDAYDDPDDIYDPDDISKLTAVAQRFYDQDLDGRGGDDDNRYQRYDDQGRVVLLEHDYGSDNGGANYFRPDIPADYREAYTYEGDSKDWKTFSKDVNPQEGGVFEYRVAVERDEDGNISKETIELDDGRGAGAADDGTFDRRVENAINTDASRSLPEVTSAKYDNDNDGTWDIEDAFTWGTETQGPESAVRVLTGDNDDANDDVTVDIAFVYGTDGVDVEEGAAGVQWIDLGPGDDDMTGGAGADVFVFGRGDGTDIIRDFGADDKILVRDAGFHPADVTGEAVSLVAGEESAHPHIPASLFPASGEPAVDAAVLEYGGGSDDRIIIVGGAPTAVYGALFMAHAGDG